MNVAGDRRPRILLVDDDEAVLAVLVLLFEVEGYDVFTARSADEAIAKVPGGVDLVLQDMNFSRGLTAGDEGVALFHTLHARWPELPVILMTAWASLETAVELIKAGAWDYVAKPWDDDKLLAKVAAALSAGELDRANRGPEVIHESQAMQDLLVLSRRVARSDAPVLITGPSGSGKDLLADHIQATSRRRNAPYVRVDLGALAEPLLEAELFGVEAGAYTGALQARPGRFELGDGGTVFLDEVANLNPAGQTKLLTVLQRGELQRVGSAQTRRLDVRTIAATNANLERRVDEGGFREDLYYRLSVVELFVPPLRERTPDILPLAHHFMGRFGVNEARLRPSTEQVLLTHAWPGNVRELENCIRRISIIAPDGPILPEHLRLGRRAPAERAADARAPAPPLDTAADHEARAEQERLQQALKDAGGVVSRAAADLGLSRQTFYRRLRRLGVRIEKHLEE